LSSDVFAWTFPGGKLKTVTVSAAAGNVTTNKSPGAGKRWLLLYGILTLVNGIAVANRFITIYLTDGTNILTCFLRNNTAFTASQTGIIHYSNVVEHIGASSVEQANVALGNQIILEGSDQLRIIIVNGQAGDSYSGFFRVLEIDV